MSVLLFFIDGLGIGPRGPQNPLDRLGEDATPLAVFPDEMPVLPFDGRLVRTDACLGIPGRPQSASGQTTILTGINAPAALGYHKQGFPNEALREIINRNSIFLQLKNAGIGPNVFANAYSTRFFSQRPRWVSATTVAVEAAEQSFLTLDDLINDRALFHDFTNRALVETEPTVPLRSPVEAATILARIATAHRFTLYEYFMTDRIGHAQDYEGAGIILAQLAEFIRELLGQLDLTETTVLLTSDHGNIEDLSARNHTLNPVPTLLWGRDRERLQTRISTLADLTPAILETLPGEKSL